MAILGLPDEMVWRTELSCGTVVLLGSSGPDDIPSGVVLCPEHDDAMVSIVATERYDRVRARRLAGG